MIGFDPCGMAVDALSKCYSRPCRFYKDQTIETSIVWYFAAPGASVLPVPTVFSSYKQVQQITNVDDGCGELTNRRYVPRDGSAPWPDLVGDHYEGTDADYRGESPAIASALGQAPQLSARAECEDHTALTLGGCMVVEAEGGTAAGGGTDPVIPVAEGIIATGGGTLDHGPRFVGGGVLSGGGTDDATSALGGILSGGGALEQCSGIFTLSTPSFMPHTIIADVVGTGVYASRTGHYALNYHSIDGAWHHPAAFVGVFLDIVFDPVLGGWDVIVNAVLGAGSGFVTSSGVRPYLFTTFHGNSGNGFSGGTIDVTIREATNCQSTPVGGGIVCGGFFETSDRDEGGVSTSGGSVDTPRPQGDVTTGGGTDDATVALGGVAATGHIDDETNDVGGVATGGGTDDATAALGGMEQGGILADGVGGNAGLGLTGSAGLDGESPASVCTPSTMPNEMWATIEPILGFTPPGGEYPLVRDMVSPDVWSYDPFRVRDVFKLQFFCGGNAEWRIEYSEGSPHEGGLNITTSGTRPYVFSYMLYQDIFGHYTGAFKVTVHERVP